MTKYIIQNFQQEHDRIVFASVGKASDIINVIYDQLYDDKVKERTSDLRAFILNLPKDTKPNSVSYTTLEQVKDGLIFNGKYKGGSLMFANPHVIVTANILPKSNLNGRIVIYEIDKNNKLKEYKKSLNTSDSDENI